MKRIKLTAFFAVFALSVSFALAACANDIKVAEIALNTDNVKTEFAVGEEFSYDGLVVTATYENGDTEEVTGYDVTEPDMSSEGEKTVTVTYEEKTADYKITVTADGRDESQDDDNVVDTPEVRTFQGITLNVDNVKRNFTVGEEFTLDGLIVTANYNVAPLTETVSDYTVNSDEIDMSAAGVKTVIITYQGKTASYAINVE